MADHTFKELTHQRVFMRMWFARLFGTTGNQMLMMAVGWQMYELTSMQAAVMGGPALGCVVFVVSATAVYATCAALFAMGCVLMAQTSNLVQIVLNGGYSPATQGNPRPFGMPPFVLVLDDSDIAAVLTHVRSSWGNQASVVSPLEVNRIRANQAR